MAAKRGRKPHAGYCDNEAGNAVTSSCRAGWKDSLLSLPKRFLSNAQGTRDGPGQEGEYSQSTVVPKLPVPPLHQTLDRYLEFAEVLVGPAQLEATRNAIKAFGAPNGLGPKLQAAIEERREAVDNWAYEYWSNDMYMDVRLPLPINSNPGMVFPSRKFITTNDFAKFAACLIDAVVDHKEMLDRGDLPLERATSREKGQPLCMAQFYRLLTSCRIPGEQKDSLFSCQQPTASADEVSKRDEHVVVACRNYFYVIPLKAADRGRLSEAELTAQLLHILGDAPTAPQAPLVGILTAERRDLWAKARDTLCQDEANQRNLDLICRALCIVCLDEAPGGEGGSAGRGGGRSDTALMLEMLHGGGSRYNTANRWFDKTVQLIISGDGGCGLCYEHSPAEAPAVIAMAEKALAKCDAAEGPRVLPPTLLPPPERLHWNIATNVDRAIREAVHNINSLIEDLDFRVFRYKGYGKDFMKSCKVSPDVFIQMALQFAYYRLYGHLVSTYESASVRRFLLGRVDNIRSASPHALAWSTGMCQGDSPGITSADDEELLQTGKKVTFSLYSEQRKMELFEEAAKKQTDTMVENILGQGIDNHLLALRETARKMCDGKLPDIFTDDTYKEAVCYKLSTSQVATSTDSFMGYGPVVPDGYGASYNPKADHIVFCLSSFHSSEVTNTANFEHSLEEALNAMRLLFERNRKP